jgi:ABC-type uncharacterized transport system substrate-binding protein
VKSVLVLMPDSASAKQTFDGLRKEIGEDFDVVPRFVKDDGAPKDVERAMREVEPSVVVLMNNPTVRLYRNYQRLATPQRKAIPSVAVLTSFLRETTPGIANLTGIIYEVPLVTSLVNLRALLRQPVKRVGVVHRPAFKSYVAEQRALLTPEGFELIGVEVDGHRPDDIAPAIDRLRLEHVDAIWVLNDNALLEKSMLQKGWLPALRGNKTPVVVNVSSLISKQVSFGTFGILPDHHALGVQAGNMVTAVAEKGFTTANVELEYPLSVETVLDVAFARKNLDIEEKHLANVDKLIQ